jgi:hypothetical protein
MTTTVIKINAPIIAPISTPTNELPPLDETDAISMEVVEVGTGVGAEVGDGVGTRVGTGVGGAGVGTGVASFAARKEKEKKGG